MWQYHLTPAFLDTDALGHINNTNLPRWFEAARNDLFRLFTPDLNPQQWRLILARIEVDFMGELFFGHDIEIRTYIGRLGNSSFTVIQQAWQQGELAAQGKATLVHYDFSEQQAVPLPDDIRTELTHHLLPQEEG